MGGSLGVAGACPAGSARGDVASASAGREVAGPSSPVAADASVTAAPFAGGDRPGPGPSSLAARAPASASAAPPGRGSRPGAVAVPGPGGGSARSGAVVVGGAVAGIGIRVAAGPGIEASVDVRPGTGGGSVRPGAGWRVAGSGLFGRPVARRVRVRAGDPADRALALEFEL